MSQYSYASMAKIAALVSGGMLDIMIADEATIRHYETLDAYLDLSELFAEGALQPAGGSVSLYDNHRR